MKNADQIQRFLQVQGDIQGWFYPGDMVLFAYLGEIQEEYGIEGNLCDLGVYHGKSLALLSLMRGDHEHVYGFDTFEINTEEQTRATLRAVCGRDDVATIVAKNVKDCNETYLKNLISGPLRFLHADADHDFEATLTTLCVFRKLVDCAGIIAVDDFFDRSYPGVCAATHSFLTGGHSDGFVPFLFGPNKLYLCDRALARLYQRRLMTKPPFQAGLRLKNMYEYPVLIPYGGDLSFTADHIRSLLTGWTARECNDGVFFVPSSRPAQ